MSSPGRLVPDLDAKGNEQQVNLDKLTVAALEGKTELKALLDWQQAISWREASQSAPSDRYKLLLFNGIG